jgi:cobyrinic acid a,c-diamide synthase
VQKEQIKAGDEAKKAEQEATRGPEQMIAEVESVNPFADDPVKSIQYEDYLKGGYPPDMAEYLVNALS